MLKSFHLSACFLSLLILTACESDSAKIQRLNQEQLIASLIYQNWQEKADSLLRAEKGLAEIAEPGPKTKAAFDSLNMAKNRLDLVTRDLNRFMR